MRILMVSDFYPPLLGGVEVFVRNLAVQLSARGHEVAVATLRTGDLPGFELVDGVRVHRIQTTAQRAAWLFRHPTRPWAPPLPDPEATAALQRIVARERPEIVHGHDWLARCFLPLKPLGEARLVMSLHYYTISCAKKTLMYRDAPCSGPGPAKCLACASSHYGVWKGPPIVLSNFAFAAFERQAVDLFIPVSRATALGNGISESDSPLEVIPSFVPDASEGNSHALDRFLTQLPAGDFMLFVGDLRLFKGIAPLLEAYECLHEPPPLVLVGKVWPETPDRLPSGVVVRRDWPNAAVLEAHRRALFTLVPSIWPEPFGLVIIEAMAAGRPVIGSRIGGIQEIIDDELTGLLVEPGDARALGAAMQRLLDDAGLREQMGQNARGEAESYRARTIVPRFERAYTSVLSSRGHRIAPSAART